MSEKKEIKNEELNKIAGGGRDGRDGGAIYNTNAPNTAQADFNAIYGVNNQAVTDGSGIGGGDPYKAGPQIMTEENDQTKDDYVNPWK